MNRNIAILACWVLGLLTLASAPARPLTPDEVPAPLKPWADWVLWGHQDRGCPMLYDSGARRCLWPAALELDVAAERGKFHQTVMAYRSTFAPLPGDLSHWPVQVEMDDQPVPVVARDGRPHVRLTPGEHRISGRFEWSAVPEALELPEGVGLIHLKVEGSERPAPDIREGRLWLRKRPPARTKAPEDRLHLVVFRRVTDDHPMRLDTHLKVEVSGRQREVILGRPLLAGFVPLRIDSPLPARLEADGRLRVQVRPGVWEIKVEAVHPAWVTALTLPKQAPPWPPEEIWSFEARPSIRLVEVAKGEKVDPRQTRLPKAWRAFPAYRMEAGGQFVLKVVRRGDPAPATDTLRLARTFWLDFDGGGFTVQDRITGHIASGWRLSVRPGLRLGRVTLNGEPRFITRLETKGPAGVEVRRGDIELVAESRVDGRRTPLPASGWDRAFQQVGATLNLPPGWRLLAVSGVDDESRSWLRQWTLYDLFLVAVIAAAVGKLWGGRWALPALFTLALIWHEPGAPRFVWVWLLALVGLLRVLPEGHYRWLARVGHLLGLAALVMTALPFMVDQARTAIYPQLAQPGAMVPSPLTLDRMGADEALSSMPRKGVGSVKEMAAPMASIPRSIGKPPARWRPDPNAVIQTGPGLPDWRWQSIPLIWRGPVSVDQQIGLTLAGPALNACFNLLRILLVALFAWRMIDRLPLRWSSLGGGKGKAAATLLLAGWGVLAAAPPDAAAADYPSPGLLQELEKRLTAPADCLPGCADVQRLDVDLMGRTLVLRLQADAMRDSAIPLPLDPRESPPREVLLDNKPAVVVARDEENRMWIGLPAGAHQILLRAHLARSDRLSLPLPLAPHRVEVRAQGWRVEGLVDDRVPGGQLHFTRSQPKPNGGKGEDAEEGLVPTALPPFVEVTRTLRLGLEWIVETRVRRLSPPGAPVVLKVPLLAGASVISGGVQVKKGRVVVDMGPAAMETGWRSRLTPGKVIRLQAPVTQRWIEVWRLDVGPMWHAEIEGIPPVHHQAGGRWLPRWMPWPKEHVTVTLTRPQGVVGPTRTIDRSRLVLRPGRRIMDARLQFRLRSSQGGRHSITLPAGAELLAVKVDGASQPLRLEQGRLSLPIHPGVQQFAIDWRQSGGLHARWLTPTPDLGVPSVNSRIRVEMPDDRWLLFATGPRLGPAVLFWGEVLVVLLVAVILGRTRDYTPLGTAAWLLLGIGLSQVEIGAALLVVAAFFAFGYRRRHYPDEMPKAFNLMQVGLVLLALLAFAILFWTVQQGLLGRPQVQVMGNGSTAFQLNWYQDRSQAVLPQAGIYSAPLWVYRLLMLAWALWLALSLLKWVQWGWEAFSRGGRWKRMDFKLPKGRGGALGGAVTKKTPAEDP